MQIYNTLTRKKEEIVPIQPGHIGIYACGPTVYNYIHIGNARPICAFDVLRRYLKYRGYTVTYVQNFTDVDDKIIKKANEEGTTAAEIAKRYIAEYKTDAHGLNVMDADVHPTVTNCMNLIIDIVKKLVDSGHAYAADNGDVYFRTSSFPEYGKLSGQPIEELQAGARIDINDGKEEPLDFAVWKAAKPGEPYWDSPWGKGRPGWHIECSAMSCHYLGETFDLHCGGQDLIFPHHENEVAQSEAANGKKFANYWMHSGPLRVRSADGTEEKMSKSLHNFWTIRDALKETDEQFGAGNGSEVLRFFLLRTQYRSPISFNPDLIVDAHKGLTRLYEALQGREGDGKPLDWNEPNAAAFADAMDDDFNTPVAVAQLFSLATEVNRTGDPALVRQLKGLGAVLNILQKDPAVFLKGATEGLDEAEIRRLIDERAAAKKARNFARADEIRDELLAKGITLLDKAEGTVWRRA